MNAYKPMNRLFLATIIVYLAGAQLVGLFLWRYMESSYTSTAISELLVLIVPCIYVSVNKLDFTEDLGFRYFEAKAILPVIAAALLMIPLFNFLNLVSQLFVSSVSGEIAEELTQGSFGLNFLFMAMIPALVEEIVFRGVFYSQYRKHGIFAGMLFTAMLFGFFHLNFNQFFYAVAGSIFFTFLYEVTGSAWSGVLAHMTINGYSVVMEAWYQYAETLVTEEEWQEATEVSSEIGISTYIIYGILAVVCTFFACRLLKRIAKICNRNFTRKQLFDVDRVKFVTIPLILGVGICLAYMIWYEFQV